MGNTSQYSWISDSFGEVEYTYNIDTINPMIVLVITKAYENFKTIYKMVEQDYKGNYEDNGVNISFLIYIGGAW